MRWLQLVLGVAILMTLTTRTLAAQAADRTSVDGVETAFQSAVRAWDVDAWASLLTEDVVMLTPFGQTVVGREAFRSYWRKAWQGRTDSGPNPLSLRRQAVIQDGDLAVVRLDYGPEGRDAVGQYVWSLVRRADRNWYIAWWIFTRMPPERMRNPGSSGSQSPTNLK